MLEIINTNACRGVAGKIGRVKGIMLHDTWDNLSAKEQIERLKNLTPYQLRNGFAHYFVDHKTIARVENTYNATYHCANEVGNYSLISFEIRGNRTTNKKEYLQSLENAYWQAAIDLRFYKLPVNRSTVRLHCELDVGTYTECPKRAMIEFANYDSTQKQPQTAINKVKDRHIKGILKYYNNPKLKPEGEKKLGYLKERGKYEATKTIVIYNDKERKKLSTLRESKGSRFIIDEIIPIKGSVPVGRLRSGGYVTVREDFYKKY